jgi:phenylalanyl-tRNA synthetase alpha chain
MYFISKDIMYYSKITKTRSILICSFVLKVPRHAFSTTTSTLSTSFASNIPPSILSKQRLNLLEQSGHPLNLIKRRVLNHFSDGMTTSISTVSSNLSRKFRCFDKELDPIVTTMQNFDELLTPLEHVSRKPTDTFYVSPDKVLRCHMTAHQTTLLKEGHRAFLMAGNVFRRDSIDATHYPVFHQIDGVRVFTQSDLPVEAKVSPQAETEFVINDLKSELEGLARSLFGSDAKVRWVEAYFPFTEPSLELEIFYEGQWLELLGCGMIRKTILNNCNLEKNAIGWAFGMGVERLAMAVFGIPDIRLFWSNDERFLSQFRQAAEAEARSEKNKSPLYAFKFQPYSKYPHCYKDVAFWLPTPSESRPMLHENDFCAVVREVAGDLCERVELVDSFINKKTGRSSQCYRITYRSMDRTLENDEVDQIQNQVREQIQKELNVELR